MVIAGLTMASKLLSKPTENTDSALNNKDIEKLIQKIESAL